MSKKLRWSALSLVAASAFGCLVACFGDTTTGSGPVDAGNAQDSTVPPRDGGNPQNDAAAEASTSALDGGGSDSRSDSRSPAVSWTYVLIDDMETTTHGPIRLDAGFGPPLTPGYWYNSGAQVGVDAGDAGDASDMSDPPQQSFVFTALPTPTTTLNGAVSKHAARQFCLLTGLYDTCGVGFEFVQEPDPDASVPESGAGDAGDAGDAGPSIPRVTIPFDVGQYKGITFWGMTTTPDATGSLQVKVQFPDTDTDPRGNVCNGGGANTTKCYDSYASYQNFTSTWQQFTILLDPGDGGGAPDGGIAIDTTWGYQGAQWIPTQIYGINWQSQKNTDPDAGPLSTEIWVDDVYFIK